MTRLILISLVLTILPSVWAERINLYLKDGGELIVSEYEIEGERVRYYAVERRAWEEIPLEIVDLERTGKEEERKATVRAKRAEQDRIERAARRKARTELHRVPLDDGVYYLRDQKIEPLKQAEVQVEGSKTRTLLQVLAPVIVGKSTMLVEGKESKFVVQDPRPMFYVRLEKISRLMLVRAKDKKKNRVVQVIKKAPQGAAIYEEQEEIEVFRQQLAPQVYKVWPVKPISPGNYAIIEFTRGEGDLRVWDFTYSRDTSGAPSAS